jgi:hypothetical protein
MLVRQELKFFIDKKGRDMRRITSLTVISLCLLLIICSMTATLATVRYVKTVADGGSNSNTGLSWSLAKATIAAAMTSASSGDEIWVKGGTYNGDITLKAGVKLYGGFAGTETSLFQRQLRQYETILIGSGTTSVIITPDSGTYSNTTRIDGFTIQGGIGRLNGSNRYGGGIYCGNSVTVANNIITGNSAYKGGGIHAIGSTIVENNTITGNSVTSGGYGGGICSDFNSSVVVRDNIISNNSGGSQGGGIFAGECSPTITGNEISGNDAGSAGGIMLGETNAIIRDNQITDNVATDSSAGAIWSYDGSPTIEGNTITGNHSNGFVGAISCNGPICNPVIRNNTITGNDAATWCGGIYINGSGTIIGNTISDNHSGSPSGWYTGGLHLVGPVVVAGNIISGNYSEFAGGIWAENSPVITNNIIKDNYGVATWANDSGIRVVNTATITNNTIIGNYNSGGGTGACGILCTADASPTISNNIIVSNQRGIGKATGSGVPVLHNNNVYSNTYGNYYQITPGTNDITADPGFVDATGGDYHLVYNSSCRDTGWNDAPGLPDVDLDNNYRVYSDIVDIGAYEYCPTITSAKLHGDSSSYILEIEDGIVTAVFDGFFYIESEDRISGIRVDSEAEVSVGDKVTVIGTVGTKTSGERYVAASYVDLDGEGSISPLGMNNRWVGGGDFYYNSSTGAGQRGFITSPWGSHGWNNIGLLIRTWGKVVTVGTDYFYIEDGSTLYDTTNDNRVKVYAPGLTLPSVNDNVVVTGISSCENISSNLHKLLRIRSQADIRVVSTGELYGLSIYPGENYFSLPAVPFNSDPVSVISDLNTISSLCRFDPVPNNMVSYTEWFPEEFQGMVLGDGFYIWGGDETYTTTYQGYPDALRDDNGNLTDICISLPGYTDSEGGPHWIGHPFNHQILWTNVLVTDGIKTIPVLDAVGQGWLEGGWTTWDAVNQGPISIDLDDPVNCYMQPGYMYIVFTHKSNLALIIPADGTIPSFSDVAANPNVASIGEAVTITFKASEPLQANPIVTVNSHSAGATSLMTGTEDQYTCTYTILSTDNPGAATIVISGIDTVGNPGSTTVNNALFVVQQKYTYDDENGNVTMTRPNGTKTIYTYDELYRLTEVKHIKISDSSVFSQVDYRLDGVGNRIWAWYDNDQVNKKTVYGYDAIDRLISAGSTSYTYDWVGNRLTPGGYTFNDVDMITSPGSWVYRLTGSLSSGNGLSYTYNSRELLESVSE